MAFRTTSAKCFGKINFANVELRGGKKPAKVCIHFTVAFNCYKYRTKNCQAKDFKLVVEAPLSNAQCIKGSSTQKLVYPLPE